MKLSEIKQILAAGDIRLTKSLGQNFLHDANQLRRIVAAAELNASDKVLEIGPGLGPLTELLLAGAGEVLAIEKDRRLVDFLRRKFALASGNNPERRAPLRPDLVQEKAAAYAQLGFGAQAGRLTLVAADALDYLRRAPDQWSDWKLVANLPYSVASPILVELAQAKGRPERMVVTLQWEVAHRLVAKRGDEDCGLLTLLIQLRYQPQGWFRIPVSCFFPQPEVDSACVTLRRRSPPLLSDAASETFRSVAKRAFSQRRKMMFKLLKEDWPTDSLARVFSAAGLAPQVRAEQVGLEEFVRLAELLHLNRNPGHA